MNKLAFTLATVVALGLSSAAFAQTSTTPSPKAALSTQSQTHATKHVKKRHHAPHYASHKGKKLVIKLSPTNKMARTKATS